MMDNLVVGNTFVSRYTKRGNEAGTTYEVKSDSKKYRNVIDLKFFTLYYFNF